ncbi:hypothetical protein L1987_58538 [Smallanthus sonchifolius]|uniref:Uncharacterized protein n=1 Tax=Smallanthus sonchifolius TaxID=185202 RepID=A0ACB9DG00_9ASTR|nr:hypothetical protein L1987_58538 [Smallanthus sonchifolius]
MLQDMHEVNREPEEDPREHRVHNLAIVTWMGKQAVAKNVASGIEGDERGPFSKAKRMSLKFASHEMKKETAPMECTEVRERDGEEEDDNGEDSEESWDAFRDNLTYIEAISK